MKMRWFLFACALALFASFAAASPPCTTTAAATTTSTFCGLPWTCCSGVDELRLHQTFLSDIKTHGYNDAECRSELKKYVCSVCVPSASGDAATRTMKSSSLPLRCAGAATVKPILHVSISISTAPAPAPAPAAQPRAPTPEGQQLPRTNKNNALPTWSVPAMAAAALLGVGGTGYVIYRINPRCQCGNNNYCCNDCFPRLPHPPPSEK
ncbi:hypothetical protein BDA96_01G039000 [Sorghum bicolor]|uniref:Gnk2-homologous domain-containing protein n=2 Tax=Sorghum bicolor TaxID=4558 RepID=A0A921RUX2_SORBI|nr:hypothetical protein BDA96_01G039000 [Sorghum bicolor]KXG37269.1 hypothetical protein SORBI_3001G037600 [Sorghum bicolor]